MRGYSKGKGVIFVQVIVLTVLVLIIFPQWVHGHYWVSLSGYGTPSIDGVMNADEWENAGYAGIDINLPDGTTTPGNLYVMNDDVNLYFAFQLAPVSETGAGKRLVSNISRGIPGINLMVCWF